MPVVHLKPSIQEFRNLGIEEFEKSSNEKLRNSGIGP
jgi:hypothetical protein